MRIDRHKRNTNAARTGYIIFLYLLENKRRRILCCMRSGRRRRRPGKERHSTAAVEAQLTPRPSYSDDHRGTSGGVRLPHSSSSPPYLRYPYYPQDVPLYSFNGYTRTQNMLCARSRALSSSTNVACHRRLLACLPAFLPAFLLACLLACLPAPEMQQTS